MAFDAHFNDAKTITVFEKIGKPANLRPSTKIPDEEIDRAWDNLSELMKKSGVQLDACNPGISKRELYRFTTEELFPHEMNNMNIPGYRYCFIYEEFYPED